MNFSDFTERIQQIHARSVWIELAALALCIAVAWGVCRWFGRDQPKDSIWFGVRIVDGLLFPLLALLLTDLTRRLVLEYQPVLVLRIAVSVFLSLAAIRLFARVLRAVFPASALVRLIERTISWIAWIGAVLWIVGLLPPVLAELDNITLAFGKTRVSVRTIFEGVLSAALVLVIALWIAATIEKRILHQAVTDLSMRKVASNAVRALLMLIGLLFALSAVGVDLTALSVLGGALGVGLGFGLQKLAANYVSGFVILLERSIRIGDNVKVDAFEGRITDIKTRYTLIRAGNGREAIVPNESLITSRVENLTLADRKFNITTNIVVGYDSDVAQVQAILCDAASAQPRVMTDPAPVAYLVNFAPDGLEFSLLFWVADPDKGKDNVRSAINIAILAALRQAHIDIPYPQRVLRVESVPQEFLPKSEAPL
ncbi:mechanosensitive ion channel family protein [Variovorax ginsengisoli]|uniref:Small-conductance mechanosensitive channel n=1 Tax=Variovorax ginsengisoli TaxID=363844 RepID=A0ABT9SC32_9BURK|nr:mechanosensitive ion channel domain-containing protein [Variovorax ginsengisoli]MDP9901413.1 small-conductance mechanosensitive channel [Variovorax ginsengisoli]